MVALVTCKNEDPIKMKALVLTTFLLLYNYGDFSRCSRANCSPWSDLAEFRTYLRYVVLVTCKNEGLIKNEGPRSRVATKFFLIITLWELSFAMDTRVLIQSSLFPMLKIKFDCNRPAGVTDIHV